VAFAAESSDDACTPFLPAAERHFDIPFGVLTAIALTESGSAGRPYPWTLNVGGQPHFAENYAAAASLLRDRVGVPRLDLAIGCMQIHMRYHLAGVGAPEWALQPRNNVWYAAAFLRRLYDQYGSWRLAIGHYNASDPAARNLYLCQVSRSLSRIAPQTAAALALPQDCRPDIGGFRLTAHGAPFGSAGFGRVFYGIAIAPTPWSAAIGPQRTTGKVNAGRVIHLARSGGGGVMIIRGRASAEPVSGAVTIVRAAP
jgi:hypothetical protein